MDKASIKLNPVRVKLAKYGNAILLAMEYIDYINKGRTCGLTLPTAIINADNYIEMKMPFTKHSIRPMVNYINSNL